MIELQGNSIYRRAYAVEKSIFEQICGTYYRQGDYILPIIAVPESVPIGVWGQRYLRYLKKHRQAIYTALLLSGELNNYCPGNSIPY